MTKVLMDRYALDGAIGAGGAATVYRAVDRVLDRVVAVKVLADDVARSADPGGRDRFVQEATSAARFQHPNLVTVFDAGEDDGELFLVMEYVEGRTLADVIAERAPLPVDEARSIARQILLGLAAVHAHGTIHRDVKPANVLIDAHGRVRLTDFGIAKRLDEIDAAITSSGLLVGTPHYLAPEQASGRPLSPATDVYQVGVVLHEMLTGVRAGGPTPAEAAVAAPVDPRQVRDDVPDAMAETVVRATRRDPSDRFDSAEAMLAALSGPDAPPITADGLRVLAMGDAGPDRTPRTVALPADDATVVMPTTPATDHPPTAVATPFVMPSSDSHGARRRRHLVLGSIVVVVVMVLGALVLASRSDGDDTVTPGPGSTVLPTTTLATPVAAIATAPPATSPPADDDERGDRGGGADEQDGGGKGKGKGKGKNKD